jgi:sigma-E factor negative regulatory protein RseB
VVLGLLGACAVLVVLVDAPGGGPARRTGHSARDRRPSSAALRPAVTASAAPAANSARDGQADRAGLRLLSQAAKACGTMAFRGVQSLTWWSPAAADRSTTVIQVWHRPDGEILARPVGGQGADPSGADAMAGQDDVMTITPALLDLMRRNYVITYDGRATTAGRPAQLVEVDRPGGGLAARFWIDSATNLPLRRELYDDRAHLFSRDIFTKLWVGADQVHDMPAPFAQPWSGQLTTSARAALQASGWRLPPASIGGLALFQATQTATISGKVVEQSYSDGLSVVSVFVQRGELPGTMPGWRRIAGHGDSAVYAVDPGDRSLAWSADGYVYTMISDAPAGTVAQAVRHLPHDSPPGFWGRIGRGLGRIVSWANPFR